MAKTGTSSHPTELELSILKLLWESSPQTARGIRDGLAGAGRRLAYSSVITTVQKMVDKGQLRQLKPISGKAFRFSPKVKKESVSRRMLADLVRRVFDGSAEAVVLSLFDASELAEADLRRLRQVLDSKLQGNKDE